MKYFKLLFFIGLVACNRQVSDNLTNTGDIELTGEGKKVVQSLKQYIDTLYACADDGLKTIDPYATIKDLDSYTLFELPYYEFDQDRFYEAPSPENLLKSFYKPKNEKWFWGYKVDTIRLTAVKVNNVWMMRTLMHDWEKVIGWLSLKLEEAKTKDYRLLKLGYNEYVTFRRNGRSIFYPITGTREISDDEFCEIAVNYINNQRKVPIHSRSDLDVEMRKKQLEEIIKIIQLKE
ncbi:MAG TPA: hypothetical protein K8V05_07665 [Butyricimonas virosa]|uniref:Uncharacterized protein n=1 Tax=Butyricimonas virosa TaxID=544645 RepID=A0A921H2Y1_9BACT|nr:hypothetical protein [Butyricimonas paravirosa]HJF70617.1 hypothetical protein [Butyricimonas virosa]